jgi:hypothetical protein
MLEEEQKRKLLETLGEDHEQTFDDIGADPDRGQEHAAPLFLIRHQIRDHEGYVRHMYRDTSSEGVVTVGIGFALPKESDVDPFTWYERSSRKKVMRDAARKEWRNTKDLLKGKSKQYYRDNTTLELSDSEINSIFNRKLFKLQQDLRREFGIAGIVFDHLPVPVQEAMYDMGWNMGAAFINKVDPEKARKMRWKNAPMWPKLTTALFLRDWEGVAAQSERGGVGEIRNQDIKDLIRTALEQVGWRIPELPEGRSWE